MVIFLTLYATLRNLSAKGIRSIGVAERNRPLLSTNRKAAVTEPTVLSYHHFDRYFYLETDASLEGIGFMLRQVFK